MSHNVCAEYPSSARMMNTFSDIFKDSYASANDVSKIHTTCKYGLPTNYIVTHWVQLGCDKIDTLVYFKKLFI